MPRPLPEEHQAVKGLERRGVLLCGLHVGLSRATEQLVVVGDLDVIREMGGGERRAARDRVTGIG